MARNGDLPVFVIAPSSHESAPVRWVSPGSSAPFPDAPPDWGDFDKESRQDRDRGKPQARPYQEVLASPFLSAGCYSTRGRRGSLGSWRLTNYIRNLREVARRGQLPCGGCYEIIVSMRWGSSGLCRLQQQQHPSRRARACARSESFQCSRRHEDSRRDYPRLSEQGL